jgi:hypothetical protein
MHNIIVFTVQTNEYGTEAMFKVENGTILVKFFNLTGDNEFDYPFEELNINTLHYYGVNIPAVFSYIAERYQEELSE